MPGARRHPRWRRRTAVAVVVVALLAAGWQVLPSDARPPVGAISGYAAELWRCLTTGRGPENLAAPAAIDRRAAERFADIARRSRGPETVVRTSTPNNVTVAVLDSGVDAGHPALSGKVVSGQDVLNPCGDGRVDPGGHGTAVAGVVIANTGGDASTVRVLPIRVLHRDGTASRIATAAGIIWAVEHGADIVNASLSASTLSISERTAIRYATRRGVLVVVAAGNVPGSAVRYPAALPSVTSVTALDRNGNLASWATRNATTDLAAIGEDVPVLLAGGGYRSAFGTSYAAPRVSAAAAELLVEHPDLTVHQLRGLLRGRYAAPNTDTL